MYFVHCLNFHIYAFSSFHPLNSLLSCKGTKNTTHTKTWRRFVHFIIPFQLYYPAFVQVVSSHTQRGGSAYGPKWISWCENYSDKLDSVSVTAVSLFIFFQTHFPGFVNSFFPFSSPILPSKDKCNSCSAYSMSTYSPKKLQLCNTNIHKQS